MMKWYENHRHNWSYCHDLRFCISFYFLWGWEAVEYGEIPPFCVYAICLKGRKITISVVFFHLIMVLCDGLSANHAKFASYIASLKLRYLESKLMT